MNEIVLGSSVRLGRTFALRPEVFMVWCQRTIRTVMLSSPDAEIIRLWVEKQPSSHTRGCYRHDSERLLDHAKKPLSRITLADLQSFAQELTSAGLAPISRVRTLAAVKSLFGFCARMRFLPVNPATELTLPAYENRLAEPPHLSAPPCRRSCASI